MQIDFDAMVNRLSHQHEREMEKMVEDHLQQTKALNEEFTHTIRLLEERSSMLKTQLEEVEERYRSRESRPEDISRIAELEHVLRENDALIRQQAEEMKFFKLELINREENFNKMFSRSPNVGVMQVIKPSKAVGLTTDGGGNSISMVKRKNSLGNNPSMTPQLVPLNQGRRSASVSLINTNNSRK
jgi:hypothetical protein